MLVFIRLIHRNSYHYHYVLSRISCPLKYFDLVICTTHPMALEPQSSGFAELRAEVLQYCCENNVTFPHTDYPFDWPECVERPASPFPEIADCFASSISLPDETPRDEETFKQYLDQILKVSEAKRDIYDIRQLTRYKLEEPLLLRQAGSNAFRKFGPDTLQKCAASISSLQLNDENGLKITKDKGQISKALEKDSKLTVTEEHTNFLKKVIEDYNSRSFPDIILAKVLPQCPLLNSSLPLPIYPSLRLSFLITLLSQLTTCQN